MLYLHTMADDKIKILYVDDEVNNLNSFRAAFRRDYDIKLAESGGEGAKVLAENEIHIIITDQRMPEMTGVEFLEGIIPKFPDPIRILLTGYTDISAVVDAINKGQVYHYLTKPWDEDNIRIVIKNAFEIFHLRQENKRLIQDLKDTNVKLEFLARQNLIS